MTRVGWLLVAVLSAAGPGYAQTREVLTLDQALAIAVRQNRSIESSRLAERVAAAETSTARSHRRPSFSTEAQVSRLLQPVDISFPAGAFGTFLDIGPVPAVDTTVTTPVSTTLVLQSAVSQPVTGLLKANVAVRQAEASEALARESTREATVALVREVRRTYYAILQRGSALEAADASARVLAELQHVVATRVAQRVVLKAEGYELDARLAQNDLLRVRLRHAIDADKEQLNRLLGRDVSTEFDVSGFDTLLASVPMAPTTSPIADRSDVRQAQLRMQLSQLAVRRARLDRLPDVNLALQMFTPMNIDGAPRSITSFGVQVKWEPFDWGRRSRAIAARELDVKRADYARRDTEDRARMEISRAARTLEEAQAQVRVATLTQRTATEQARVRSAQFQADAVMLSDALQAEANLSDASNTYQQAVLSILAAQADLDAARGKDIQ